MLLDYILIAVYMGSDWLRGKTCHALSRRNIMPVWNMKGVERYEAVLKTKKTVFARRD